MRFHRGNESLRESQADLRFLSEPEFAGVIAQAAGYGQDVIDLLTVTVGTGLRYGEVTALWRNDYDPINYTLRVNKAWKREGEGGETDIPTWLKKQVRPKHTMRDHYLGNPKTPRSRRTIAVSPTVAEISERRGSERASNDFLFTSPMGKPLHNSDFYVRVWRPLMDELDEAGIAPFRFHDLRHTHVAWLIAGGAPLPHIQARLGHESRLERPFATRSVSSPRAQVPQYASDNTRATRARLSVPTGRLGR